MSLFMDTRNFPSVLREQVLNFYKVKYPNKRTFDEQVVGGRKLVNGAAPAYL